MAFVHPNDVLDAFDTIVAALRACFANAEIDPAFVDAIENFCEYVRDNYVRRLDRRGTWQAPRVANAGQWNCHFAAMQGFHRTNNSIEAWNRQFAQLFPRAHCAMDKFIYRMQTDEDRTRQALCRLELHPNEPLRRGRRSQHVAADAALRELVDRYDEFRGGGRLLDFMCTVQYHLSSAKFPDEAPADDDVDDAGNEHGAAPPAPALPDFDPAPQALLSVVLQLILSLLKLPSLSLAVLKLQLLLVTVLKLQLLLVPVLKMLQLLLTVLKLPSLSLAVLKLQLLLVAVLKLPLLLVPVLKMLQLRLTVFKLPSLSLAVLKTLQLRLALLLLKVVLPSLAVL